MTTRGLIITFVLALALAVGVLILLSANRGALEDARCQMSPETCPSPQTSRLADLRA